MIEQRCHCGPQTTGRAVLAGLLAVLLAVALCGCMPDPQNTGARHFVRADQVVLALEGTNDADAPPPPPADTRWRPVDLPDVVNRTVTVQDGSTAGRSIIWYRVTWKGSTDSAAALGGRSLGLYVPRAIGQPLRVWRIDGDRWLPVHDNRAWAAEQWNRPLLAEVPGLAAPAQELTLAVGMPFRNDRFHAMSSLWVGPMADLRLRADRRSALQLSVPQAATFAMVALGALSFAVWLRRRHERAYLYFALTSAAWAARNLHLFINIPADPWRDWFWWMNAASISWMMLATYQYAFQFDARRSPRVEQALVVFVIGGSLLTVPLWDYDVLLAQHAVNLMAALIVTLLLSKLAWRGGSRELRVIVAALWLCFIFAVHDWLLVAMRITPETIYLLPYGSMLVILSFLHAAMWRFNDAIAQVEATNMMLESKLMERQRELEVNHARLRTVEREQAVLIERQRMIRDMHDGVGSTLIATLRGVERGDLQRDGLIDVIRSAIDDLRVSIDSLEPIAHDLTTLLASFRTRMSRRLEAADLRLKWTMGDLPTLPWLDAPQALEVLRLLQEALANIIKHAGARSIAISAQGAEAGVLVQVVDDGVGFDTAQPDAGRGLPNMRERARLLGGRLTIESSRGGGTAVRLWLPAQP